MVFLFFIHAVLKLKKLSRGLHGHTEYFAAAVLLYMSGVYVGVTAYTPASNRDMPCEYPNLDIYVIGVPNYNDMED